MARKVFISVLGTGYYKKTNYFLKNRENTVNTHFIQNAALKILANTWESNDKAFIFLTKKAKTDNWISPAQQNNPFVKDGKSETYQGLQETLLNNNYLFGVEPIDIADGNSEKEIWDIFESVYNTLNENDEVYFDITHAFRSIPMLVMVLINYAKFLKNIEVKSITYGNWEGRDEDNYSPIIDLITFSHLQDWTNATGVFLNFGHAHDLSTLLTKELTPILKEAKGENEAANRLRLISKQLPEFTENILTARGKEIVKNMQGKQISQVLSNIKTDLITPFTPIVSKLSEAFHTFKSENSIINGFHAVQWCIDNNLIQQGITILKEMITSFICIDNNLDSNIEKNRNLIDTAFAIKNKNLKEKDWNEFALKNKEQINKLLDLDLIKILYKKFNELSQLRNDINHAGFKQNVRKPKVFKEKLNELNCWIIEKIL